MSSVRHARWTHSVVLSLFVIPRKTTQATSVVKNTFSATKLKAFNDAPGISPVYLCSLHNILSVGNPLSSVITVQNLGLTIMLQNYIVLSALGAQIFIQQLALYVKGSAPVQIITQFKTRIIISHSPRDNNISFVS